MRSWNWEALGVVVALIFSSVSLAWNLLAYGWQEQDERTEREIKEIDRIFDPTFSTNLSYLLEHAYTFLEMNDTAKLTGLERFEVFWDTAPPSTDPGMMIIYSRLQSLPDCIARDECGREGIFSRFPAPVYQALAFLGEFVFLPSDLQSGNQPNGWWLGEDIHNFLVDYCEWVGSEMPLWSPFHEQLRIEQTISPTPQPCLHRPL